MYYRMQDSRGSSNGRCLMLKGCAFAAVLHLFFTTISTVIIKEKHTKDAFDIKLIRERKDEGDLEYAAKWHTPIMNTFWEPVPGGCCGASEEGHNKLIATWKSSWENRGWETRILTLDDAKKHPDFDKLEGILQQLEVNDYNRRCFYRWLAMVTVGGGWMSDYDTFPLRKIEAEVGARLGRNGKFTSFEGHVPCLVSANADEWEKIAQEMIKRLSKRTVEDGFTSDMLILLDIKDSMGKRAGRFGSNLITNFDTTYKKIKDHNNRKVNCANLENKIAVHFSHGSVKKAIDHALYPIKIEPGDYDAATELRADAARLFLDDYHKQCEMAHEKSK